MSSLLFRIVLFLQKYMHGNGSTELAWRLLFCMGVLFCMELTEP
jgi:hypothetical protein